MQPKLSFPHEVKVKTKHIFWIEYILRKHRCEYSKKTEGDYTVFTVEKCKGQFRVSWWD